MRLLALIALLGIAAPLHAQQSDSARNGFKASFSGRIYNSIDSTPVRTADVRLFRVDSVRVLKDRRGKDSLDIFVDTARSRIAATDSTGAFIVRRMEEGHYVLNVRRIGFGPVEGIVRVDSGSVTANFSMEPTSRLLAKVMITETSVRSLETKLDRVGFVARSHSGESATFITRDEAMRRRPLTIGDVLRAYGVNSGEIIMDRMPLDYADIEDYPADLLGGIEIYRHGRPPEFNMTRKGPGALSSAGQSPFLIVIWTFIP
jgi:hypothetical protein